MLPTPPASPSPNGPCPSDDRIGLVLANWLELTGKLGVGAYGVVYSAMDVHTGEPYAVKALNKVGLDARQRHFQAREIQLHHEASHHPNVVSLVKIMDNYDCTYVVLEYCPEGDLFSSITEKALYLGNDHMVRHAFLQILDAVGFCHSLGTYHRDLKPENILVSNGGLTVKLADFGLATKDYITDDFGCGSTFYMSPECQAAPSCSTCYASGPNDVWSLGIILVNLTCGRNPWKRASMEDSTFRAYRNNPQFLKSILPLSPELDGILGRIFECDPGKRITIPELRFLIERCHTFTTRTSIDFVPTPPNELNQVPEATFLATPEAFMPFKPYSSDLSLSTSSSPSCVVTAQFSSSSEGSSLSDNGSFFSASSSCSSSSSYDGFDHPTMCQEFNCDAPSSSEAAPVSRSCYYHNGFTTDSMLKSWNPQAVLPSVQVF